MARRADVLVAQTVGSIQFSGAGTAYLVESNSGDLYYVYADTGSDLTYKKSSDGGLTWGAAVTIFTGTLTAISVWFDRWSSISAGLIHCAYSDGASGDTLYRTIDTESSDALSTQTVIFAGTSTASGGHLSITRARGGNVLCKTVIDNGVEGGFFRLPNANVPNGAWDAARTVDETIATGDNMILVPGFAADNQDIMGIFLDSSANEISRKIYDDSADTWSETTISGAGNVVEGVSTTAWPHLAATVDLTNSRILLVFWSAIDTANADLRCFTMTESAITETATNVVLNSTDDQGLCGISLNTSTNVWSVVYGGKSDGSETFTTALNLYMKASTDSGATWGPETLLTTQSAGIGWFALSPRTTKPLFIAYHKNQTLPILCINVDHSLPTATAIAGVM